MNIKTLKKEYEVPEMSVLDYEYSRDCLLVDSDDVEIPDSNPSDVPEYKDHPFG